MNITLNVFLLLSVPGLPLLLAFPALRSRLPWPCHLALLPALVLVVVPASFSIDVPWLLLGTGLGIDGASRWLLAMSLVLWIAAATVLHAPTRQPANKRFTTLFLLTMAGNMGVILVTDLVGFFTFSILMGLGFYGLLVDGGDETARRAGRVYLSFMVLADVVLFDALVIAAATTGDLGFEAVRHAIGQSHVSGLYVSVVLVGFALKAGVWPLHFWLALAFGSVRPAVALLLGGVPVAMGLLGMVRWLPLGELAHPGLGAGIQWVGLTAAIYGTVVGLMQSHPRTLLAYAGIVITSLFVTILGSGLEWPTIGSAIQGMAHLFILSLGLVLAALVPASLLADKAKARLVPHSLLVAGYAAAALLLALSPMMILYLTRIPAGGDPLFAGSMMVALWPWWTLCTTLLAVRWLFMQLHRQKELVSVPALTIAPGDLWLILERWFSRANHWAILTGLQVLPCWRASGLAVAGRLLRVRAWQKALYAGERSLQNWTLAVTLLLLLAIAIALV